MPESNPEVAIEPGFRLEARSGCFSEEMQERAQAGEFPELIPLGPPRRGERMATRGGLLGRALLDRGDRAAGLRALAGRAAVSARVRGLRAETPFGWRD